MALTSTRTHTVYFGDDTLEGLREAIAVLERSFADRREHISEEVADAIERRLVILDAAAAMLAEPVPESFD